MGASTTPGKLGHELLLALRASPVPVFAINPRAGNDFGVPSFPSLAAVDRSVDLALLAVPAAATLAAVEEAAAAGVRALVLFGGGFAEAGVQGLALQNEVLEICRANDVRLLGPNTSGFARPGDGLYASFVPMVRELQAGTLAIVAQSGGVNLTLAFMAQQARMGISLAVGLGNAAELEAADMIDFLADDEASRVIVLHLEGVRDGRRLFDAISNVVPRKPVVVLAAGRESSSEFARSHTGNLMGRQDVVQAACRQAGAVVVKDTEALITAAAALMRRRARISATPGVALVSGQAGPALLISDTLHDAGVAMPRLAEAHRRQIRELLPLGTFCDNPVDTGRPDRNFGEIMRLAGGDPAVDIVAAYALHEPGALDAVAAIEHCQETIDKPVVFGTMGPMPLVAETLERLEAMGVPVCLSPEATARAVMALHADAVGRHRLQRRVVAQDVGAGAVPFELPDGELAAKTLLRSIGIDSPRGALCGSRKAAHAQLRALSTPLVVKTSAAGVLHKTEQGGVVLGVTDAAALDAALDQLDRIQPEAYLLEEMVAPGVDLIVGAFRDPAFGPVMLVGLGGTAAEALRDVAMRLAPIDEADALDMLAELQGQALLEGWRGQPAVPRVQVAKALTALSALMLAQDAIHEIDINPLRCLDERVIALDAVIVGESR
ncbi:MAG: acetate--CoA ligase family protein [Gammaproteobacteria bacterium]|nr:acetate--CoA ligase family protein [Gammaproteobacteria bacterium]